METIIIGNMEWVVLKGTTRKTVLKHDVDEHTAYIAEVYHINEQYEEFRLFGKHLATGRGKQLSDKISYMMEVIK